MKKQAGVSVLEVVISIIILVLIAFFAIFGSQKSVGKAEATELYGEMKSVQAAVEVVRSQAAIRDDFSLKQDQHYDEKIDNGENVEPTYIIYGSLNKEEHPEGKAAKYMDIENLKRDYIVSYETGRVSLRTSVDIQGTAITEIEQLESYIGISK